MNNVFEEFEKDTAKINEHEALFNLDGVKVRLCLRNGAFTLQCRAKHPAILKRALCDLINNAPPQRCADCGALLNERGICSFADCFNKTRQSTQIKDVSPKDVCVGDIITFPEEHSATDKLGNLIRLPINTFYQVIMKESKWKRFDMKVVDNTCNRELDITLLESESVKTIVAVERGLL